MIILDTNVVAERIRSRPDEKLVRWFDEVPRSEAATTTITVAELRAGAALLPQGRRRANLELFIEDLVEESLHGRVETFDLPAAARYASVIATGQRAGRPIETADALIAAICISRGAVLATRNTKDFEGLGITLLNPWEH